MSAAQPVDRYEGQAALTWWRVTSDDDVAYELSILAWAVAFALANFLTRKVVGGMSWWASRPRRPAVGSRKDARETTYMAATVVGCAHALMITLVAAAVLAKLSETSTKDTDLAPDVFRMWRFFLSASLGFFISDFFMYCIPLRDYGVMAHHVVMVVLHFPVGARVGIQSIAPPGAANFIIWCSAAGYVCEGSNLLLNSRWFLMKLLWRHIWWFRVNNLTLLFIYVLSRVVWFPIIMTIISLRKDEFFGSGRAIVWAFLMFGYGTITLMSAAWTRMMLSKGLGAFLTFGPPKGGKGA